MSRPLGTSEEFLLPHEVKVGDLFQFDHAWYPVQDMVAGHGGSRILHFNARSPYTMSQAEIIARPISYADETGRLGRLLSP
ncbi:hypothetical protein [Streptomyces sp. AP-93]|uniref:hypothetical protein n=1 Tax=Streptomyces sp. AP-93 TaxID=2929048 RepID=UPI001FAF194B|nr:hypothetical protein [Streptomyces sp. AP-93]MCJ0870226.1 hypothetical protein [Streptomyces sp. AP-93]